MLRPCWRKVVGHCSPEQGAVGPLGHRACRAFAAMRVQRLVRAHVLQHITNERGVAHHIVAYLQHRYAAVAAGEGLQIRLGHDLRLVDRLPGDAFVAKNGAQLLCKGRCWVMVKVNVRCHPGLLWGLGAMGFNQADASPISSGQFRLAWRKNHAQGVRHITHFSALQSPLFLQQRVQTRQVVVRHRGIQMVL